MDSGTSEVKQEKRSNKFVSRASEALLSLVSRGSSILCEVFRLKDYIPEVYTNPAEEKQYKDIIFDFSYSTQSKTYEDKIINSQELKNKDEEFRENNIDIIERFFGLFDSINNYITDWSTFINQVNQGIYAQTIDNILQNKETCKLLCESIFLIGVMLLLVDRLIPDVPREKLLISYYRYKGQTTIQNFDRLIAIFRRTGYHPPTENSAEVRPKNYPVEYFKKLNMDTNCILKIIGRLKENDIYDQVESFPNGDHKAHALSGQAAMLFVTLFFVPEYLEERESEMRNIGDQYFNDNWVLAVYMGYTFDISVYWKEFRAARKALDLNLNYDSVRNIKDRYNKKIADLIPRIKKELAEGNLTEDYVLRKIEILLELMRESNVVLRWFLLQRQIANKKFNELINQDFKSNDLIELLLVLSQFEYLLKDTFTSLINDKIDKGTEDKNECGRLLKENFDLFSGAINIGVDIKNEGLQKVFQDNLTILNKINISNSSQTIKYSNKIMSALEEIKTNFRVESNAQIKSNVYQLLERLSHIILLMNLKKRYLINISRISDFSYAWISIQDYQNDMQSFLKKDTKAVLLLRATFLKLASILNFPLIRLFEIESQDIESVTNYYSGELIKFVKNVLQIIPNSVFNLLKNIIKVFQNNYEDLPIKIAKDDLNKYIQKNDRYTLAKSTHKISLFTRGILMMKKTLMGIIEVDPKQILEEGIRKELLNLLASEYHQSVDFICGSNIDLMAKLSELNKQINCIKKSFIYIQDYININGSKMWGEEMHRLVNNYVILEANKFLQKKIRQNLDRTIVRFPPLPKATESETFLGRLTRYVISLTLPRTSNFSPANFAWFDNKEKEVFGIRTLNMIKEALGIEGFQGINKLLNYMNYQNIFNIQDLYKKTEEDQTTNNQLRNISKVITSPCVVNYVEKETSLKIMVSSLTSFNKSKEILNAIVQIGHIELLRKLQYYSLTENVEVDSYILTSEIRTLNSINLHILNNFFNIKFNLPDGPENDKTFTTHNYFKTLCEFFDDFGFIDPKHTFYYNLTSLHNLPLILAIATYSELTNYYSYDKKTEKIKKVKGEDFDLFYFTYGVYSILYQMGKNNMILFIALLSLLLRNHLLHQYTLKDYKGIFDTNPEVQKNVAIIQMFLQSFKVNCGVDLAYFDINFNCYLMFRNIAN